jgi:AcrR family transcriptional regulator
VQASTSPGAGRPRSDVNADVFAATLRSVHEFGYAGATMDRIAVAAGVAKTTLYRRWPSKGALITACLVDVFGPAPIVSEDRDELLTTAIRWGAAKISEPGVGAAFAGVFTDAVSDPALREILSTQLQAPYLRVLQEALGESEQRVRFVIDVIIGTLLHRMGISGEPMAEDDVEALIAMVLGVFR